MVSWKRMSLRSAIVIWQRVRQKEVYLLKFVKNGERLMRHWAVVVLFLLLLRTHPRCIKVTNCFSLEKQNKQVVKRKRWRRLHGVVNQYRHHHIYCHRTLNPIQYQIGAIHTVLFPKSSSAWGDDTTQLLTWVGSVNKQIQKQLERVTYFNDIWEFFRNNGKLWIVSSWCKSEMWFSLV